MQSSSANSPAQQLLLKWLHGASMEITPHSPAVASKLVGKFPAGANVYISCVPGTSSGQLIDTARALKQAGFTPVPHIAARSLASRADLDDMLQRLAGEADCRHALLIAGDVGVEKGPFSSILEVLETGLIEKHGVRSVGFAGHPEGHHIVHKSELSAALNNKLRYADDNGLSAWIVTQFCFEAKPVCDWISEIRRSGIDAPIHIGIAGPANPATLLKYAVQCGVGNSLRVLMNAPKRLGKILSTQTPDALLEDLSEGLSRFEAGDIGMHIFSFGGVVKSARWLAECRKVRSGVAAPAVGSDMISG